VQIVKGGGMNVSCPKCGVAGKYSYDGCFIRCKACGYTEWAKKERDGHITDLVKKWRSKP